MTKISRKDLHAKIWQQPMSTVAREFGLSDRGLAKICEKFSIPRPPRGYWARLQHGYPVEHKPMRNSAFQPDELISINLTYKNRRSIDPKFAAHGSAPEIIVAEILDNPHPITKRCRSLLNKARKDDYGRLYTNPPTPLKIGKVALPRALRVLDAVLKASVALGYTTDFDETKGEISICVEGEKIGLTIDERCQRTDAPKPKDPRQRFYPRYQYSLTGKLTVHLDAHRLRGLRRQWQDTPTRTLESQLGKLVAMLPAAAQLIKNARIEEAAEKERWRLQQQRSRRHSRRHELIKERGMQIENDAMNWQKAKTIRDYLQAIEATDNASAAQRRLTRWAWTYADHIDPLTEFRITQLDTKTSEQPAYRFNF